MPDKVKKLRMRIKITLENINMQTGELTNPRYKADDWPEYLKGTRVDLTGVRRPVLFVFRIKNETGVEMHFDRTCLREAMWVAPGNRCPPGPGKDMEIRVSDPDEDVEKLRVWDPNNSPGDFSYQLRLRCPAVPGGIAWLDPVITNSGGGGGGHHPDEHGTLELRRTTFGVAVGVVLGGAALVGAAIALKGAKGRPH